MSYQPKFTITPELLARVEKIAALRERILAKKPGHGPLKFSAEYFGVIDAADVTTKPRRTAGTRRPRSLFRSRRPLP